MSEVLQQARREFERRRQGEPKVHTCALHGEHTSLICTDCYSIQQERIERESVVLRYANTAPALRDRIRAELAARNGC